MDGRRVLLSCWVEGKGGGEGEEGRICCPGSLLTRGGAEMHQPFPPSDPRTSVRIIWSRSPGRLSSRARAASTELPSCTRNTSERCSGLPTCFTSCSPRAACDWEIARPGLKRTNNRFSSEPYITHR